MGRICCFGSANIRGQFSQLNQSPDRVRFDPNNDMLPIVNESAESSNSQSDVVSLAFASY